MAKKDMFDEVDSDASSAEDQGQNSRGEELKINEEFAKRFEYNKKREEKQRLEEKFKARAANGEDYGDESASESSEDETEDEEGFLATEELDAEISATLQAIKNKDPRIYNPDVKFIKALDENPTGPKEKKEKPLFLRDYHRERYMAGDTGADVEETNEPRTFVQEQADLKNNILAEINAAGDDSSDDEDGFIKAKPSEAAPPAENGIHPSRKEKIKPAEVDVSLAEKDPETFLSNFMAARAWVPEDGSRWDAFESDDGEGNDDADEWEAAYNLRFEDPTKSNEVLKSYSRKVVEARTVRREELKGRKRQRELEKERKEEEKRQRHEERSRLKKLKIEEAEEKLKKIKKAAGLSGKQLKDEEWMKLLEGAWENNTWEEEMSRRFGDQYYAEAEEASDSDEEEGGDGASKQKKPKKPKWDDDIDIKDIIPDFEDEEAKPAISLTDDEAGNDEDEEDEEDHPSKKRKTTKDHKAERQAAKRASRQERSKIEALVEHQMELDDPTVLATSTKNKKPAGAAAASFRYRETSPQSFGLTPRDILLAPSDTALNEFAGLKKLATFRDKEKKKKDRKRLGKKARLREWRREVFGREYEQTGPTFGFGGDRDQDADDAVDEKAKEVEAGGEGSKKKRKRSKGKKKGAAEA
ncbi:Protein kri1 [Cytospora mali]|uniref:Protein kri1 n=1 Tax=Cytospora mali TaxID=578113 RepID=A0A194VLJ5_CYTMA|nr:Protein kri1 [Valsa mali]